MKYTDMFTQGNDPLNQKALSVEKAANTKAASFSGKELTMDLEQFRAAFPNASPAYEREFLRQQRSLNQNAGEDFLTDLQIAGNRMQQLAGGLAGLVGVDAGWEYAAEQQDDIAALEAEHSAPLQAQKEEIAALNKIRQAQYAADGNVSLGEEALELAHTVKDYVLNPRAAASAATQSADSLVAMAAGGGVVGAAAKKAAQKKLAQRLGEEGLKRAGAQRALNRIGNTAATVGAERFGSAYTGVSEGTHNAVTIRDRIRELDDSVLAQSQEFRAFAQDNPDLSMDQAKDAFALSLARQGALGTGIAAALLGKATGASKAVSTAAIPGAAKDGVIRTALGGAKKEAIEETAQSASGELIANAAVSQADESQSLTENIGHAAGSGLVAGGLSGGAVTGAGRAATKGAEKAAEAVQKRVIAKAAEAAEQARLVDEAKAELEAEEKNAVTKYSPETSPVEETPEEVTERAQRTRDLQTQYANHTTDSDAVKQVLSNATEVLNAHEQSLNAEVLGENPSPEDVQAQVIEQVRSVANLAEQAHTVLEQEGDTLSDNDKAALAEIVTLGNNDIAPEKTLVKLYQQAEAGQLDSVIEEVAAQENGDHGRAFLKVFGEVALYSRDGLGKLSAKSLNTLAQHVEDTDGKALLQMAAEIRDTQERITETTTTGSHEVSKQLWTGDPRTNHVGVLEHLDTVLKMVGAGNLAGAQAHYNGSIAYLRDNNRRKRDALKAAEGKSGQQTVRWITGTGKDAVQTNNYDLDRPSGHRNLANNIANVESDLAALEKVGSAIEKVLFDDKSMRNLSDAQLAKTIEKGIQKDSVLGTISPLTQAAMDEEARRLQVEAQAAAETETEAETETVEEPAEESVEETPAQDTQEETEESYELTDEERKAYLKEQQAERAKEVQTVTPEQQEAWHKDVLDSLGLDENNQYHDDEGKAVLKAMYGKGAWGRFKAGAIAIKSEAEYKKLKQWAEKYKQVPTSDSERAKKALEAKAEDFKALAQVQETAADTAQKELDELGEALVPFIDEAVPTGSVDEVRQGINDLYQEPLAQEKKEHKADHRKNFVRLREAYIAQLTYVEGLRSRAANLRHRAELAAKGEAVTETNHTSRSVNQRVNQLAKVLGKTKSHIKLLAGTLGISEDLMSRTENTTAKVRKALSKTVRSMAESVAHEYLNGMVDKVRKVADTIKHGDNSLQKAIHEVWGTQVANSAQVQETLSKLKDQTFAQNISHFRDSPLWEVEHLLTQPSEDPEVQAIQASYQEFKVQLDGFAFQLEVDTDKKGVNPMEWIRNKDGTVNDHFAQTTFLAFAEVAEKLGTSENVKKSDLEKFANAIEGANGAEFAGMGTLITRESIMGTVKRHTYLVEEDTEAQRLPAIQAAQVEALIAALGTFKEDVTHVSRTLNNIPYNGYYRNPKSNKWVFQGKLGLLGETYNLKASRENHLGKPPGTDYSEYADDLQEFGEITENTPYYFNMELFGRFLEGLPLDLDETTNKVLNREQVAEFFAITFMGAATDAELDTLNQGEARGKRGVRDGIVYDFLDALDLYERILERGDSEPTPIHFSSHFGVNGRQFFDGAVNPQASKLHRILVRTAFNEQVPGKKLKDIRRSWQRAYNKLENGTVAKNNFDNFLLAMALGLGADTDKQANQTSLKEAWKLIGQKQKELQANEVTSINEYLMLQAAQGKTTSFEELEAVNALLEGQRNPLPYEVDGKTNGPFHANWVYGLSYDSEYTNEDLLMTGGMKFDQTARDTHHDTKQDDLYVKTSAEAQITRAERLAKLAKYDKDGSRTANNAFIESKIGIDPEKGFERKHSKGAVTSTVYGGSIKAIVGNYIYGTESGSGLLNALYADISAHMENPTETTAETLLQWEAVLGDPMQIGRRKKGWKYEAVFPLDNANKLKQWEISPEQLARLKAFVEKGTAQDVAKAVAVTMSGSVQATADATAVSGTMIAVYNHYLKALTSHVLEKHYKNKPGLSLSKEHQAQIRAELKRIFPQIESAIDDHMILDDVDPTHKLGGTTVLKKMNAGGTVGTLQMARGMLGQQEAGVKVTPQGVISIDASMQRLTAKLIHAVTGKLQLNVFDAQDIASNADLQLNALLTNMAETITIMEANPLQNLSDAYTTFLAGLGKPVTFEGEVVLAPLDKLAVDSNANQDSFEAVRELSEELSHRLDSNGVLSLMGGLGDFQQFMEDLGTSMQYRAEANRLEQERMLSKDGMKVHQLAGVDGTGVLLNKDGTFNWDGMVEALKAAGYAKPQDTIDRIKALPDVQEFEARMQERMEGRTATSITEELTQAYDGLPEALQEVEDAKGSGAASVTQGEIYPTSPATTLLGKLAAHANKVKRDVKRGITTMEVGENFLTAATKTMNLPFLSQKDLTAMAKKGLKVVLVDPAKQDKYPFNGAKGMYLTGEHTLYLLDNVDFGDISQTLAHELTHSSIHTGLTNVLAIGELVQAFQRSGNSREEAFEALGLSQNEQEMFVMLDAVTKQLTEFLETEFDSEELQTLQAKLQAQPNDIRYQLHEFMAYMNEVNTAGRDMVPENQGRITYNRTPLSEGVKANLDKSGFAMLQNLYRAVLQFLKGFFKAKQEKLHIMSNYHLLTTAQAVFSRPLERNWATDTEENLRYESRDIQQDEAQAKDRHDSDHLEHLNALQRLVDGATAAQYTHTEDARRTLLAEAQAETAENYAKAKLVHFKLHVGLTDRELALASQLVGMFSVGSKLSMYNRNHAAKLYKAARDQLSWQSFMPADVKPGDSSYNAEVARSKAVYRDLFEQRDSLRIERFLAMSQVSPTIRDVVGKLQPLAEKELPDNAKLLEQLRHFIRTSFERIAHKIARLPKGNLDTQTQRVLHNVITSKAASESNLSRTLRNLEDRVNQPLQYTMSQTSKAVKWALSEITGKPELKDASLYQALMDFNEDRKDPASFWRSSLLEFFTRTGHSAEVDRHTDRVKYRVDGERKRHAQAVISSLENAFGRTLSKDESAAVLNGEIKGDLASLLNHGFTFDQVTELLQDPAKLTSAVNVAQNEVFRVTARASQAQRTLMVNEAKALGYRMVQGGATAGFQYPNAYAIAKLSGTQNPTGADANTEQLVPVLDKLAALSAIQHMDTGTREALVTLRTETQGIPAVYKQLKANQTRLENRHGKRIMNQVPKGYIANLNDQNARTIVVPEDSTEKHPGYTTLHTTVLPQGNKVKVMYNPFGGNVPYVAQGMSLIEDSVAVAQQGETDLSKVKFWEAGDITRAVQQRYQNRLAQQVMEPRPIAAGGLVPNVNMNGDITGYHFELSRKDAANAMDTSQDYLDTLSEYSGRIVEEDTAKAFNRELVELLHKQATAHGARGYIKVSADSEHQQLREAWKLMPRDMKRHAKRLFGEPAIYVHRDDVNQVLGYRERSLTALLNPENHDEGTWARTLTELLEASFLLTPEMRAALRKGGVMWREAVTSAKDLIVVKSGVVPAANMVSNMNQLSLRGVDSEDILKHGLLCINAKRELDRQMQELYLLRVKRDAANDATERNRLTGEIEALSNEAKQNPVYRLVHEEGLNPAVIEELGEESQKQTFRKKLLDRYMPDTSQSDNGLIDIGKEVVITQDSSTYKLMNEGLELGDFVGKFILYKHLTELEQVPHKQAVEQVRSEFINYNRAQHSVLDYLNKVGGMFFFKYFMRIQPIIMNSIRKNPSRAMAQVMSLSAAGIPSPYEAFLLTKDLGAATGPIDLMDMAAGAHPWLSH